MKRPINVAQCVFDLSRAGAQRIVYQLVASRDASRYRHVVYTFNEGPLSSELRREGAKVIHLPQHFPFLDPSLFLRLSRSFRAEEIHVVHTHLFGADLHAGLAARAASIPAVTTIHSNRPDNWRQRSFGGFLFAGFDRVVAVGDQVLEAVARLWPRIAPKIRVIHNGVSVPKGSEMTRARARAQLGIAEQDFGIGTIGRLANEKAHTDLIAAFKIVQAAVPRARLVIVGEGPLRRELEVAASAAGLTPRICLPGNLPNASQLLFGFDLFVLASIREGLPLSLLEAMAAAVPCVSTDVGSIREALHDGVTGRLVPPGSPAKLAEALLDLIRRPDDRALFAKRASDLVFRDFSAAKMVASYEEIYQDLASADHLPRP